MWALRLRPTSIRATSSGARKRISTIPQRYYWKITFEDGLPVIGSVQVDDYRIVYELWGMQFAPCRSSNTDTEPIVILKLEE